MYNLPRHKEHDPEVIRDFIERYPFAFLVGADKQNKPVGTQVPIFIEERNGKEYLTGHFMRNTDHHNALLHNNNVLVVFTGRHTYVSGTWYSNPQTASTWNYMSVHAKGIVRFLDDTGLEDVLRKTTLHFEKQNKDSPTTFDNLPIEYKQKLMHAIVAFEIEVVEMDTVFKLSQDRDYESYQNIIGELRQQGVDGQVIASEMEKRTKMVFPDS